MEKSVLMLMADLMAKKLVVLSVLTQIHFGLDHVQVMQINSTEVVQLKISNALMGNSPKTSLILKPKANEIVD